MKSMRIVCAAVAAFGLGVAVRAATVYVAPTATGAADGSDAGNAMTLADGVAAACEAGADSIVRLADGVYEVNSQIAVTAAITLVGNDDPSKVVITNTNAGFSSDGRFFQSSDAASNYQGLTMTGAKLSNGDGACVIGNGGVASNCVFRANRISGSDGCRGMLVRMSAVDCAFLANEAPAATCLMGQNKGGLSLTRCAIIGNIATGGGFLCNDLSGGKIIGCLIAGNVCKTTSYGSGGINYGGSDSYYNCTIVGNSVVNLLSSDRTVYNCIVWGNTNATGQAVGPLGSSQYSCLDVYDSTKSHVNSLTGPQFDPQFVDFAGGDFRLKAASPCKDAASRSHLQGQTVDLDGNPREYGSAPDMGCYEKCGFGADDLGLALVSSARDESLATEITVRLDAGDGAYSWAIDWGEEAEPETGTVTIASGGTGDALTRAHTYARRNVYTVSVVVTRADTGLSNTLSFEIPVIFPANSTIHLDAARGDDRTGDGSAEKPFATLRAFEMMNDGCTFVLAPGDYPADDEIVLARPNVRVLGDADDPSRVVIRRPEDAVRQYRLFTLDDADALLSGLTILNGHAPDASGGGGIKLLKGHVENCIVRDCRSSTNGGGLMINSNNRIDSVVVSNCYAAATGGAVYCGGAILSNCVFYANHSAGRGAVSMGGCTIYDSKIFANACAQANGNNEYQAIFKNGGHLYRCLLVGNGTVQHRLFNDGGSATDCLFIGNFLCGNDGFGCEALVNCTMVGNTIGNATITGAAMKNCLLADNRRPDGTLPQITAKCYSCAFASNEYAEAFVSADANCVFTPFRVRLNAGWDDWRTPQTTPLYRVSGAAALATAGDVSQAERAFDLALNPRRYADGSNAGKVSVGCYQLPPSSPLVLVVR